MWFNLRKHCNKFQKISLAKVQEQQMFVNKNHQFIFIKTIASRVCVYQLMLTWRIVRNVDITTSPVTSFNTMTIVTSPHHPFTVAIFDGHEVFVREGNREQNAVHFTQVFAHQRKRVEPLCSLRVEILNTAHGCWGSLNVDASEEVNLVSWSTTKTNELTLHVR